MKRRLHAALLALFFALPAASFAVEGDPLASAKRLFEAGSTFFAQGQYLPAIRAFEEAGRLHPSPAVSFSLAQALRLQYFVDHDAAKLRQAVALYRGYVDAVASGARRPDAVAALSELEPLLRSIDAPSVSVEPPPPPPTELLITSSVDDAVVSIDGGPARPLPAAVPVTPGPHTARVTHPEHFDAEERLDAIEGRSVGLHVALKPRPARVRVEGDGGVTVELGGRAVAETPLDAPIEIEAGAHELRLTRPGYVAVAQRLELLRGQEATITADLAMSAQRKWSFGLIAGSALVLAGAGVSFGLAAGDDARGLEILAERGATGISTEIADEYDAARSRRDVALGAGASTLGVGIALAVTGVVLLITE